MFQFYYIFQFGARIVEGRTEKLAPVAELLKILLVQRYESTSNANFPFISQIQ